MPELPEVETIKRDLGSLVDRRIQSVEVRDDLLASEPDRLVETVPGWRIESLERRGKYLLLHGEGGFLLFSLRMTGNLTFEDPGEGEQRYVAFDLDDRCLYFTSVRRFSRVYLYESTDPETVGKISKLGADPLNGSFGIETLSGAFENRTAPVKTLLMNQEVLAGIGNIYANEICFEAGVAPDRSVSELDRSDLEKLVDVTPDVLERAIRHRGSSINDFERPGGNTGGFQDKFRVYGRRDEACPRCGTPVKNRELSGRSTFFCPECQG